MAGGGNGFSSRAITEGPSSEEPAYYELSFRYFKENKVEIASAITKPFPFLMSLRDRGFISEYKYKLFQESCENLVPVNRVMYDVLSDLEKRFSKPLLRVMFSPTNLTAYPDLKEILRSSQIDHRSGSLELWGGASRDALSSPPRSRPEHSGGALDVLGGAQQDTFSSPPRSRPGHRDDSLELFGEAYQNGLRSTPRCRREHSDVSLDVPRAGPQDALCSPSRSRPVSCDPRNSQMSNEEEEEGPSKPQYNGGEGQSSRSPVSHGQGPRGAWRSSRRPGVGADQSANGNEMCPCVMCSPRYVPKDPEARMGRQQADTEDAGNSGTSRKPKSKRRKKKGHNWTIAKRKRQQNIPPKKKGRRKRKIENVDFHAELLPVTCGELKGILYKKKLKKGVTEKSIQTEDGEWFTPAEFEIRGGYARSKNWKLSLRCHKIPLKWLIERKFLSKPPRKYYGKRTKTVEYQSSPPDPYPENANECTVCQKEGMLVCCDTCFRAFHENCHVPKVEADTESWSCIFCRVQFLGSPQSHSESEILQRQMQPEEQLKCEFILLNVYCRPESSFFAKMPYYYYFKETLQALGKHVWLDMIKKRLSEHVYSQVEGFVQDMRLIFQNHRASFKDAKFGQMGLKLEGEFEKIFKEVFAIQETNENC